MKTYKKILLIQTAFLGDAILTTPLVRALKSEFPDSSLDVLVIPQTAAVFRNNPHIRNIIEFDKRSPIRRLTSIIFLVNRIRKSQYSIAVSAQLSLTTSFIMFFAGIPYRLGFPRQKLINMTINLPKGIPVVKRYLKLMEAFTEEKFSHETELYWDETTENTVNNLIFNYLDNEEKVIGISPGSVWATKRWLPEYYAQLISLLTHKGIKTILIGGSEDVELCRYIASKSGTEPLIAAGKLSLSGSAALISKLKLLVTNDSAPLHMANAVKTDVVAIFGPTVRRFGFYPYRDNDRVIEVGLSCRPCGKHGSNRCPRKHFSCMKTITPDIVLQSVLETLELS